MGTKKIVWLQIVQGLAMLMVVLDHDNLYRVLYGESDPIGHFVRSFHMSLFMFVSGGLFYMTRIAKGWDTIDVYKDKIKRLMVPYLTFSTICFLLKASFSSHMKRSVEFSVHDFLQSFLCPSIGPLKEMWFIATLFTLMLFYPFYRHLLKLKVGGALLLLIGLIMLFGNVFSNMGPWFNISQLHIYAIYFFGGMVFFKNHWERFLGKTYVWAVSFVLLLIVHLLWDHVVLLTQILGIIWSISFCMQIEKIYPKCFSTFRDYTFQIYLMGLFGQMFIELFVWKRIGTPLLLPCFYLVSILIGLYMPVIISKLIERLNNKYISMFVGLK